MQAKGAPVIHGISANVGSNFAADAEGPTRVEGIIEAQAAEIAHYRKMYDRISSLAKIGVWEFDLVAGTLSWTDEVYDLFELPRGMPIDRPMILAMYEPESRKRMERLRTRAIEKGGSFALDISVRGAKGSLKWLRLTADVEQEGGRSVRLFGTKQDITEARSAQDKLQSLQAELIHASRQSAMGAMVATLAHDLNQPLTAIANYAAGTRRAIRRGDPGGEMTETGLHAIEESAAVAGNIIRRLRTVTGGSSLGRHRIDPNPVIREAVSIGAAGAPAQLALSIALCDDVFVDVDPLQIQQVVINLVRNAIEAVRTAPRCAIEVRSCVDGDVLEIRVDDTGHGIAAEVADSMFESFITTRLGNMGVGLSIARTIVEAHGGRMSAGNRAGGGASFRFALPLPEKDS